MKNQIFLLLKFAFSFFEHILYDITRRASVTQLVEYHVANVTVDGSNPFTRSIPFLTSFCMYISFFAGVISRILLHFLLGKTRPVRTILVLRLRKGGATRCAWRNRRLALNGAVKVIGI